MLELRGHDAPQRVLGLLAILLGRCACSGSGAGLGFGLGVRVWVRGLGLGEGFGFGRRACEHSSSGTTPTLAPRALVVIWAAVALERLEPNPAAGGAVRGGQGVEGCGTGETEHFNGPLRLRRTLGALLLLASPGPPAAWEARRSEWRCGARAKWVPSAGRAQGARRRSRVGTTAHMAERI